MSRHSVLRVSLAFLSMLLPAAAGAGTSTEIVPPDSFILQHSASVAALHQQVTLDPVVRRRLARHFHTSGPALARYIQDNLVLKKTVGTHWYPVYCVAPDGHEYLLRSRVAAGTPVFVLRATGQPVLKLACGNPMTAALPPVAAKKSPKSGPEIAALLKRKTSEKAKTQLAANRKNTPELSPALRGAVLPPTTQVSPSLESLAKGSHGSPLGYLAAIPLAAGFGRHHSGPPVGIGFGGPVQGGNSTPPQAPSGSGGVSPVPEPSTTASFAVGGFGLLLLIVRARRRASIG